MLRNANLALATAAAALCFVLTGCGPSASVTPLGNDYDEVTYTRTSFSEPESHQITLQRRKPGGGRKMIWAYIDNPVINEDVAVFAARVDYNPRLFAVKGLETPLDITDEVFWRWSIESGHDFADVFKAASIYDFTLKSKEGKLCFEFGIWTNGNSCAVPVNLSWPQVSDIMREVKEKGALQKTLVWGKSYEYLAKDFQSKVRK